jgi:Superfamily I DNA and RNA helicases and helicase subunits
MAPVVPHIYLFVLSMHSQICDFPSKTLSSARLKPHSSVASRLLLDLPGTHVGSEDDEKELLGTPVVFFDTAGCEYFERVEGNGDEGSRCNENEVAVVKHWVDQLVGNVGYLSIHAELNGDCVTRSAQGSYLHKLLSLPRKSPVVQPPGY